MTDAIHGVTLQDAAEIFSKDGELKAEHGERAYRSHFVRYLQGRGLDEATFAAAWNGWWARMEADPSGQLHARFAMMQQELVQQAHLADVPDASQSAFDGLTLETYARLMAEAQQGHDLQQLVTAAGLTWAQWQRGQAAWNEAMAADVNHHITTQYGQLYAKYMPGFREQMQGQTAAIMAGRHAQNEGAAMQDDEPEREYTFDDALREVASSKPLERWAAAHHLFRFYDIGDPDSNPRLREALRAIPVAIECLERHDEYTVSNAESLATDLSTLAGAGGMTRAQADDAHGALQRCLARAQERLETLHAAFAPIRNKAVPERVKMQSAIQDYTSLVETLESLVAAWAENARFDTGSGGASAPSFGAAPSGRALARSAEADAGGGFLAMLKGLPVIGAILRALGL